MFYSHEILTSRKYGVATVWLVATLGAKSNNTKKITRKAILDVNIKKACSTISDPEAPMALRLQSNLLYGVSRVFYQQCGYVLHDAQAAQNALRALIKPSNNNELDFDAGKARPEQLILLDDPAFLPENALPALDFDFDLPNIGDSQRSTQSMLSIRGRSGSVSSSRAGSVLGLNLPSSSGHSIYQLPNLDTFGNTPINKDYGGLRRDEEEQFIDNDNIFEFNEHGELLDLPVPRSGTAFGGHRRSDSAASGRVRKEHENGLGGPLIVGEDDFMMQYGDDDMGILPDAEPFGPGDLPLMTGGLGGDDQPQHHSSQDRVHSLPEEGVESLESSVSAQAPQKQKPKKALVIDKQLNIRNDEFKRWHTEYATRMAAASLVKEHYKANTQAKKNAFHFVFGSGINGVGEGIGSYKIASPLDMFSGEMLRALVTGKSAPSDQKKGTKRSVADDISPPSKRPRDSELGRGGSPPNNNPLEDDGGFLNIDDGDLSQSVEYGRDAGSAIADHPSSALMPWNKSASLHSHQRNLSSQHGRAGLFGSQLGSFAHRLASSPLVGRGSNLALDMEQLAMMQEDDVPMYGRDNDAFAGAGLDFGAGGGPSSSQGVSNSQKARSHEDFEMFGQAAGVDTQTAGTSQWVRDALDKESSNFFEYVRNTIEEKQGDDLVDDEEGVIQKSVTFEELFNVEGNSSIVAAQAFYHVLCLATKRKVWVQQEQLMDEDKAPSPFGEIRIGVVVRD